ncbi:hypothetical protein ACCO44_02025 [Microbacterium maritypicum]|uniref:hypothetical protein n=1 Tax=Microbacterium maritypicum TaxID=33918 RepID=UPI0035579C55
MFEHTFFTEQYTGYQQEEMERAAARRRMLIEHADQIVPRPPGAVRRMLTRIFRADERSVTSRTSNRATTAATVCDRTASPAR